MKILIITGSHPRHLYIHQAVLESGAECAAIIMERENLQPSPPSDISEHDRKNFIRHFEDRFKVEAEIFGDVQPNVMFDSIPTIYCTSETLNSDNVASFVKEFSPDLAFIFGPDLIKDPLLSVLPKDRVNLHLGLSPWYRGSATLFWPFYFLQPQFAGATFHQILPEADSGAILHQCVPKLVVGDGIHDVGVKVVVQARSDLNKLLKSYLNKEGWSYKEQTSSGRLFLTCDFEPAHLRSIYDTFQNKIVDAYLNGELGSRLPKLISNFKSL
jgi:methionyl-tRNA formyltransferase